MERVQLPPNLEQKVSAEHQQSMLRITEESNKIAYLTHPAPIKTSCKWNEEQRRQNNKLSVNRSRVRERARHRLLEEELHMQLQRQDVLREERRRLQQRRSTTLPAHSIDLDPDQLPHATPITFLPCTLVPTQSAPLDNQSPNVWACFPDEQQIQDALSSTCDVPLGHQPIDPMELLL
ncbi:unnamed protein product [Agarophyton chilense]